MRLFFFFFFSLHWEWEKTGVLLALYKTLYNLLTGVPWIKKTTVLLSCETSSMSHWFRSNHKGRIEDYTVKFVLFSNFRVKKEVDFHHGHGSKCLWQYFLLYFSLSLSFPHGSWEEDFKVFYTWLRTSTFRLNLVLGGYAQWKAFSLVFSLEIQCWQVRRIRKLHFFGTDYSRTDWNHVPISRIFEKNTSHFDSSQV